METIWVWMVGRPPFVHAISTAKNDEKPMGKASISLVPTSDFWFFPHDIPIIAGLSDIPITLLNFVRPTASPCLQFGNHLAGQNMSKH